MVAITWMMIVIYAITLPLPTVLCAMLGLVIQKRESFLLEGKEMYSCDKAVMIKMVNADGELGEGRVPNC